MFDEFFIEGRWSARSARVLGKVVNVDVDMVGWEVGVCSSSLLSMTIGGSYESVRAKIAIQ